MSPIRSGCARSQRCPGGSCRDDPRAFGAGRQGKGNKENGVITLVAQTSLADVPTEAWDCRLGSRSALEWVLDQYKERKPRDPIIREGFNTYRFADHKERVVDQLGRVWAVSAFTTTTVNELGSRSTVGQG